MKIDLDDIERRARHAVAIGTWHDNQGGPVVLALIARIRELEAALESVADDRDRIVGVLGSVTVGDVLERGAVLP